MICTYIFRDTKLNTLANYLDAGKPKICLRFDPNDTQKSLWHVLKCKTQNAGCKLLGR